MRIGNLDGRLVILTGAGGMDVERASGGRFGADPQAVYPRWAEFTSWAAGQGGEGAEPYDAARLGAPAPAPRQSFGIGLNYRDHAAESGLAVPEQPSVFTKFPSCITGPYGEVVLPAGGHTDWEVELVAVIGAEARHVAEADGWSHVAGLCVGQDISERITQLAGAAPQFSMGKSFPGFGPIGPWLVTPDELPDPDDLRLRCSVGGRVLQDGRTGDMIFSVPELVARISAVCPMLPGDLIFTGTPSGVGMGRKPPEFLRPGTTLVSTIDGLGELRNALVAGPGFSQPGR